MTRILVQRGYSGGSSSNTSRSSSTRAESQVTTAVVSTARVEESDEIEEQDFGDELLESYGTSDDSKAVKGDDLSLNSDKHETSSEEIADIEKAGTGEITASSEIMKGLRISERVTCDNENSRGGTSHPPPPPIPPPKPSASNLNSRRVVSSNSSSPRIGPSRRAVVWPVVSRPSPTESRPSSPRSHESEGYNSADEQNPCFGSSYYDNERERQFEIDIRRAKGLEVKRMIQDGNCLFRAVADQVYGDSEAYDLVRQMCIDYMERERDHFSQFITEGFISYCKRKRRDKVYGNNVEIQAMSEMYNRPIHIYSYSIEPINIFHGNYNTDVPPIRLSYHHGNHYNSLVDPRRLTVGAGLGFSCLRGTNVDKDQVKAAIKAQQDQQIDNALLAEGRFYSDLELTEKEIERMVMEASRAEYHADNTFKKQIILKESSASNAEPSSSGASSKAKIVGGMDQGSQDSVLSGSMQMVMSMGFSYMQVIEAYNFFGDDVDSMVCYLLETSSNSRRKGKAAE